MGALEEFGLSDNSMCFQVSKKEKIKKWKKNLSISVLAKLFFVFGARLSITLQMHVQTVLSHGIHTESQRMAEVGRRLLEGGLEVVWSSASS